MIKSKVQINEKIQRNENELRKMLRYRPGHRVKSAGVVNKIN